MADIGVCHHDPVRSNFVSRADRLYLLDWEYAARGFIAMDYAALSVEWKLDCGEILGRVPLEPAVLDKAKTLYLYLCRLWEAGRRD
jgi:thiamine kinase-like enzyme